MARRLTTGTDVDTVELAKTLRVLADAIEDNEAHITEVETAEYASVDDAIEYSLSVSFFTEYGSIVANTYANSITVQ